MKTEDDKTFTRSDQPQPGSCTADPRVGVRAGFERVEMSPSAVRMVIEAAERVAVQRERNKIREFVYSELARTSSTSYGKAQERVIKKLVAALDYEIDLSHEPGPWNVTWEPEHELFMLTRGAPEVADTYELAPCVYVRVSRESGQMVSLEVVDMQALFDYLQTRLDAAKAERALTPAASEAP